MTYRGLHALATVDRESSRLHRHDADLSALEVDLSDYQRIRSWDSREALVYQVLLVNGVIAIGSSETEVARFPAEVRKASHIAERIMRERAAEIA